MPNLVDIQVKMWTSAMMMPVAWRFAGSGLMSL